MTTTGAYNQPYLLIQSINPTEGEWNDTSFQMTIMVKASTEFNDTANVDVRLWRTGTTDIPADSSSVSADGTRITSNFDLSNPAIKLGVPYNISVYWKQGGWTDIFRSCFEVVQTPPNITSISTPADPSVQAWGYAAQTARRVIIKGDHLSNPTSVILQDQSSGTQISGTVVNVPGVTDQYTIVAVFNLASTTATKSTPNSYWDVMVTTAGGNDTSSDDSERLLLNPTPTVTAVIATDTGNSPPSWSDWAFASQTARKVRVKGTYLYGMEMDGHDVQHPADNSAAVLQQVSGTQLAQGKYVSALAPGTSTAVDFNDFMSDTEVVLSYDFTPFSAAKSVSSTDAKGVPCDLQITNYGGSITQSGSDIDGVDKRLRVNPPPVIDYVYGAPNAPNPANPSGSPAYFSWAHGAMTSRNVRVAGQYLYGLDNSDNASWLSRSGNMTAYATYTPGQTTSANDWTTDTPVIMTYDPSSQSYAKTTPNNYWGVRIRNYGGLATSTSAQTQKRVLMNPTPVLTRVTPTSSPNYYDWAHGGMTSRRVRIEGQYLYALDQTDTSVTLSYLSSNPTARATFVSSSADPDVDPNASVIMNFNPSSSAAATTVANKYWDVNVTNYGGTETSGGVQSKQVYMNPTPIITGVSASNPTASPNYFSWAHGGMTSRNVRIEGYFLYMLNDSGSTTTLKSQEDSSETSPGTLASGQNPADFEADMDKPMVRTFNPSSVPNIKTSYQNKDWKINVTTSFGVVPVPSGATVKMNPGPVITRVSATSASGSPPYFDWAHAAETARNVRIEGNYLYALDQSDTTVQLEYGGNRTLKATFTPPQNPALYDVYIDTPVVMTFNPSLATGVKTASDTWWNVEVTNYGGPATYGGGSTTPTSNAQRVHMNPPPVITAVTATSSPNYFSWAYLSQTSRNVRVEGQYLYGLDQVADSSAKLRYNNGTLYETATKAISADPDPTVHDTDINAPAILTFYPSSAAPAPPATTYDKYWDVRIQNYGGTITSSTNAMRVYMNPLPTVASIQVYNTSTHVYDAFSTASTGSATHTNYKVGKEYTVGITGTYMQAGSSIDLALGTFNPVTGTTTYVPLTGGTVAANGASITGLTMNVSVNPTTTASFMKWGGSTLQTDNTLIAGVYHLIFVNSDGTKATQDRTLTVTHATFTVTATSKQTAWGSVSVAPAPVGGYYYQDQSVTATATPGASASGQYQFVYWQSGGVDQTGWGEAVTFTDSATHTIVARFRKKLYWSTDGTASANWASFVAGYDSGTGADFTALDTVEDPLNPSMYLYAYGGYNREIAGVTNSSMLLTGAGASTVYIDWKQINAANSYLVVSTNKTSGYNTYNLRLAHTSTAFARVTESLNVSSLGTSTNYYVRVHSRTPSSTTNTSTIRVYRVWLE